MYNKKVSSVFIANKFFTLLRLFYSILLCLQIFFLCRQSDEMKDKNSSVIARGKQKFYSQFPLKIQTVYYALRLVKFFFWDIFDFID